MLTTRSNIEKTVQTYSLRRCAIHQRSTLPMFNQSSHRSFPLSLYLSDLFLLLQRRSMDLYRNACSFSKRIFSQPISYPQITTPISNPHGPIRVRRSEGKRETKQCSVADLFADGDDYSPSTIEKRRNLFYQNELKKKIEGEMTTLAKELTDGLNIHLNVNQSFVVNTSSIVVSFVKTPVDALLNQTLPDQRVTFPSALNLSSNRSQSLRVTLERLSSSDYGNGSVQIQTNLSRMVSLSILDSNGEAMEVKARREDPFVFFIPHDQSVLIPSMVRQNVTTMTNLSSFNYHFVSLVSQENRSIHVEFQSLDANLSYMFVYRFDLLPIYNRTHQLIDGSFLFCSSNNNLFKFYLDNEQTFGHRSLFIGVGELNESEAEQFCSANRSNRTFDRDDQRRNFTLDYFLRLYQSGCFYLDDQHRWRSDGLRVSPDERD